jgi:hypothetical protein
MLEARVRHGQIGAAGSFCFAEKLTRAIDRRPKLVGVASEVLQVPILIER